MSSKLALKVERIVTRETSNLGTMIVSRQFERLGVTADEFGPEHLVEFIDLIQQALVLFVGEEQARKVAHKISSACQEELGNRSAS